MKEKDTVAGYVPDSRQQPAWHVIVLGIFTCSLYIAYWAYKTWRDLKRESIVVNGYPDNPVAEAAGIPRPALPPLPPRAEPTPIDEHTRETLTLFSRISPFLRGIGVLIPVLNIYLLTTLTIGIANLVPDPESLPRKHPLLATGYVVGAYLLFVAMARLPGSYYFVSLLSLIPIAFAQHWLNQYWEQVEASDILVRHGFSLFEMLTIIIGASLLGLASAGLMIGIK